MDSPTAMPLPAMHHDPAGRLAVHAAALQPARAPAFASPQELSQQPLAAPAPNVNNWAADFTRFASQQPQHQRPMGIARQPHAATPMQMGFQSAFAQQQQPAGAAFSPFFAPAGAAYGGQTIAAPTGEADFDQEMAQWMANNHVGGNMEQVDAAMEQMARELELNEAGLVEAEVVTAPATQDAHFSDLGVPELTNLSLESRDAFDDLQHLPITGEDEPTLAEQAMDAEALKAKSAVSEAAERLLESVQHESGEKWQNSVFLSLMRDFRDGRKDIIDNEIRQTEGETEGEHHQPVMET